MRPVKGNVFIDSNILIYCYSNDEAEKRKIACDIISENETFISSQVLQEFINTITKKFKFSYADALKGAEECCRNNNTHINTQQTIFYACQIAGRYNLSFYDSLIIAAAIEAGCKIVYSEDMQHNQMIDNKVRVLNPFLRVI